MLEFRLIPRFVLVNALSDNTGNIRPFSRLHNPVENSRANWGSIDILCTTFSSDSVIAIAAWLPGDFDGGCESAGAVAAIDESPDVSGSRARRERPGAAANPSGFAPARRPSLSPLAVAAGVWSAAGGTRKSPLRLCAERRKAATPQPSGRGGSSSVRRTPRDAGRKAEGWRSRTVGGERVGTTLIGARPDRFRETGRMAHGRQGRFAAHARDPHPARLTPFSLLIPESARGGAPLSPHVAQRGLEITRESGAVGQR